MNRKTLLVVLTLALAVAASACGSSSPTVTISTPPPATLEINNSATIAATTTHDSGEGVDWSCAPAGSCGTLNPTHTASGATTVYTAPSVSGTVTITATSTKKASVAATATVTISPVATVGTLTGTYTFYINGFDAANGAPYSVAGSVAFDGAGNITGGEQDFFDTATPTIITADPIIAGSGVVTVGDDGRGSITITPTTAAPETLSITVVNGNHALIEEFDANATSAGSLDLQTAATSVPSNGNAFTLNDIEDAFVFGGVVTSDGTSTFTAGEADDDAEGTATFGFDPSVGSSFSGTDASGRGTIVLNDAAVGGTLQFAYYVVGPEAFRLIETDGVAFAAGSMFGQGSGAGSFTPASLTGSFVFGNAGRAGGGIGIYAAAGQFTTDGSSAFTAGVADANLGDGTPVLAGDLTALTTYFVDANGYGGVALTGATTDGIANFGVYLTDPAINVADPNNTSGGGSAVMLDLDAGTLGAGIVVPQVAGATAPGNLAFNQDGIYVNATNASPFDLVGQILSDGTSAFSGLADFNDLLNTGMNPSVTVSGTIAADSTNPGRSTVVLTVNGSATPNNITVYQASSALALHVDTDNSAADVGTIASGVIEAQQ
jgi:hypothetical protein